MFKTAKQLKRQYQCITFHFLESLIENQEFSGYQFYLTTSVMQTVSFNWFLSQWQKSEKCIFSKSKMSFAFFYFRIYGPYHKQNAYTLGPTNYQFVWHCGTNGEFFGLLNEFSACWNKSLKSQKQKIVRWQQPFTIKNPLLRLHNLLAALFKHKNEHSLTSCRSDS